MIRGAEKVGFGCEPDLNGPWDGIEGKKGVSKINLDHIQWQGGGGGGESRLEVIPVEWVEAMVAGCQGKLLSEETRYGSEVGIRATETKEHLVKAKSSKKLFFERELWQVKLMEMGKHRCGVSGSSVVETDVTKNECGG